MRIEQSLRKTTTEARSEDEPRVEVLDGPLCSAAELQRAVMASAVASGLVCAIAGVGIGFLLGLREGGR